MIKSDRPVTIGSLARQADCKVQTIRYYEQIGLMPAPARTTGNQRLYDAGHLRRLKFIRHSRQLGFSLNQTKTLLQLSDNPNAVCHTADEIARAHLEKIDTRIAQLQELKEEVARMVNRCSGQRISECEVIGSLADHSRCLHPNHSIESAT